MPYDEAERKWKIHILDPSGQFKGGYLDPDALRAQHTPAWMSRPKGNHFEVLYRLDTEWFAVLFRFSKSGKFEFTNRDYFQELTLRQTRQWFEDEGLEIPSELLAILAQATSVNQTSSPSMFPADHYRQQFGLPPNTLNKARRDGRLPAEKRNGRWFYAVDDVQRLWPDVFSKGDET